MEFAVKNKRSKIDNVWTKGSLVCMRTISINKFIYFSFLRFFSYFLVPLGDIEEPKWRCSRYSEKDGEMTFLASRENELDHSLLLAYGPSGVKGLSEKDARGSC